MAAACLEPSDNTGHPKQGKPSSQRSPFGAGVRGEVWTGRNIRREEETLQNVKVALVTVIEKGIPTAWRIIYPRILQNGQYRRNQQRTGNSNLIISFSNPSFSVRSTWSSSINLIRAVLGWLHVKITDTIEIPPFQSFYSFSFQMISCRNFLFNEKH